MTDTTKPATDDLPEVTCTKCWQTVISSCDPSNKFGGCPVANKYANRRPAATPAATDERELIRRTFLAHGFTIKTGCDDLKPYVYEAAEALLAARAQLAAPPSPIDMVLHCPACGLQHIDAPEFYMDERATSPLRYDGGKVPSGCNPPSPGCRIGHHLATCGTPGCGGCEPFKWTNPPHRSHMCHNCCHVWRPADVPTNGVAAIKTRGNSDSARRNTTHALAAPAAEAKDEQARDFAAKTAVIVKFAPMVKAVIDLLAAVDEKHETEAPPLKFTIPYGAINALRAAVGMVPAEAEEAGRPDCDTCTHAALKESQEPCASCLSYAPARPMWKAREAAEAGRDALDAARLDFLEGDNSIRTRHEIMCHEGEWWVTRHSDSQVFVGDTLRAAVDAARAAIAGTPGAQGER